jgi:hypothetical protein
VRVGPQDSSGERGAEQAGRGFDHAGHSGEGGGDDGVVGGDGQEPAEVGVGEPDLEGAGAFDVG